MKYWKGNWNLLIAFVIIAIISVLQWNRWGIKILQELDDGNFFFLGGPSLFYPTALFPSIVALGYLISFLCSLGRVEINRMKDMLNISEKKGFISQNVTIPSRSVTSISLSNTKIGWSAISIIPLVLSSYYLYIDGISLLTYHAVYGFGIDTSIYYVLQASGNVVAILLVLFMSPGDVIIRSTHIDRIIVQLPIIWTNKGKNLIQSQIAEELEITAENSMERKSFDYLSVIIYGIILIVLSILSRIILIFSNEVLRIICIYSGLLFITYGVKNLQFKRKNGFWFSVTRNHRLPLMNRIWLQTLSGVVILSALLTFINNFIYISQSYDVLSTIIWNIMIFLIIILPGGWITLRPVYMRLKSSIKRKN